MPNIKAEINRRINNNEKVIIELGPGNIKSDKNAIGIDIFNKDSVDFIYDLSNGLQFLDDNTVDLIISNHFLEHMDNLELFMSEIYRVLKKGGKKIGTVPHFSNPYFYSDYTHKNFWGMYTLLYFSDTQYFKRDVPLYYNSINFQINKIRLVFRSPFIIRHYINKVIDKIFNSNKYLMEFYEENLTGLISCYEIKFEIEKK